MVATATYKTLAQERIDDAQRAERRAHFDKLTNMRAHLEHGMEICDRQRAQWNADLKAIAAVEAAAAKLPAGILGAQMDDVQYTISRALTAARANRERRVTETTEEKKNIRAQIENIDRTVATEYPNGAADL
jgi:hypothetical protein